LDAPLLLRKRIRCVRVELEAKTTVLTMPPLTLTLSPKGRGNTEASSPLAAVSPGGCWQIGLD